MKTFLIISSFIVTFLSCKPEYKECEFSIKDEELLIYNEILNELVEHHFYSGYLGNEADTIFRKYDYFKDTAEIKKELIKLQNKVFMDTSRFCALLLDTGNFHLPIDSVKTYRPEIIKIIKTISPDEVTSIYDLNSIQEQYTGKDFQLCTSRVLSYDELKKKQKCYVGKLKLSKLILNKEKTKGLLYYEFICGGKCGMGELVEFEKVNKRWRIKNTHQFWIS